MRCGPDRFAAGELLSGVRGESSGRRSQRIPSYRSVAAFRSLYFGVMNASVDLIGVVDDDASIRGALDGLLRSAGFRVVTFPSAEALLVSTHLQTLACLILDLQMPGIDGLSLQRRLADEGYRIPIIVLTAHGKSETRTRAVDAGAMAFLTKPFDSGLLLAEVTRAVTRVT
jgi:FixJ family two-component response regulator